MRYPASEKLEIIRIVEQSHLSEFRFAREVSAGPVVAAEQGRSVTGVRGVRQDAENS